MYVCMSMCDYVWLCMTMYDYVWLFMTMYTFIWLCMTTYDYSCLCMPVFDYLWLCTWMYDFVCLRMTFFTMYDKELQTLPFYQSIFLWMTPSNCAFASVRVRERERERERPILTIKIFQTIQTFSYDSNVLNLFILFKNLDFVLLCLPLFTCV